MKGHADMARKPRLRIACGQRVSKDRLEAVRDSLVEQGYGSTLAQRVLDRSQVASRIEAVHRRDVEAGRLVASLLSIEDDSEDHAVESYSVELAKSRKAAEACLAEVFELAGDEVGFSFSFEHADGASDVICGSRIEGAAGQRQRFEHPCKADARVALADAIESCGLPDIDRIRRRFGFSFPIQPGESPVDIGGRQLGRPILTALEEYRGSDRSIVLADAADLIGMRGLSTNEARFLVAGLNATPFGSKYCRVTELKRYDKVDRLSSDGIHCVESAGSPTSYGIYGEME